MESNCSGINSLTQFQGGIIAMAGKNYSDEERKTILKKVEQTYNSSKNISIKEACKKVGITDSTYYNWRQRLKNYIERNSSQKYSNDKSKKSVIEPEVEQKVISLKEDKPFLGFKKISKQMAYSFGIKISSRKVKQILEKNDLAETNAPRPKKKKHNRRFERLSRNEMWMMDLMHYSIKKEGKFYLISILDDYSRYIVAHGVFKKKSADNVIDVFHEAIDNEGQPDEFLTDRGSQFHSWKGETRFRKLLDKMNIKHILASAKSPQTIGKIESFHRNIQRELLRQQYFDSIQEAKTAIDEYIQYYNHERVHMGIDYLTPADRYFGLKQEAEKLLDPETQTNDTTSLYLTGRIEGEPLRAQENNQGQVEVFLAGKKIKEIDSPHKIKDVFQI